MVSKGSPWGGWFWGFEVKSRMQLSEGSYNKKSSLKFCIWFQRVLLGAGGFGCLRSNLGCDFQRAHIRKIQFEMLCMVSKGSPGGGWIWVVKPRMKLSEGSYNKKVVYFYIWFQSTSMQNRI